MSVGAAPPGRAPILALTQGDPAGVGPEILLKLVAGGAAGAGPSGTVGPSVAAGQTAAGAPTRPGHTTRTARPSRPPRRPGGRW